MRRWLGIMRYEFSMASRRKGLWISYGLLFAFYTLLLFSPPPLGEMVKGEVISRRDSWPVAGRFLIAVNVFFPVVAGILSADRLRRDVRLGLRELQESTTLSRPAYVSAKYLGNVAACVLPLFVWVLAISLVMVADGHASAEFLIAAVTAALTITLPAIGFVVAFSLACPMVMPTSVYQILFTGYWFWANFVPPRLFPTLNGTLFTPSGLFVVEAFFTSQPTVPPGMSVPPHLVHTAGEAMLNLLALAGCAAVALTFLVRLLGRQARRA
jgi:ABC-2 type transport system permease protein